MNRLFVFLSIIASASSVFAQDLSDATYIKIGNDQSIVYPLPKDILVEHDFRLTMDDGVEISMNIYQHMKLVNMGNHSINSGKKYVSYLMLPIVN